MFILLLVAHSQSFVATFSVLARLKSSRIKSKERLKLIKDYIKASGPEKALMEKRHGKRELTNMMNEFLSEDYKEKNTRGCPNCQAPIQKFAGCNMMTCNKCNNKFCYICGSGVNRENPYSHFQEGNSNCGGRLFEGLEDAEEGFEEQFDFFEVVSDDEDDFGLFINGI